MVGEQIKVRSFPEKNYRAIYFRGKTLRQTYRPKTPISELDYPEFYDVKITNHCNGKCPWCYQDSLPEEGHFDDILNKINDFFGCLDDNQKPFQVAIGGGEPTGHPDFIKALKLFHDLGITPNYTTNGMFCSEVSGRQRIIEATRKYCGGVAISCHPHLRQYWEMAASLFLLNGIKLNFHLIISDGNSVNAFLKIYEKYKDDIDYFVLLPHTAQGRANHKRIAAGKLFKELKRLDSSKIAFGANFYDDLKERGGELDISLYEPEIMSKYLDMKNMKVYKSSFHLEG